MQLIILAETVKTKKTTVLFSFPPKKTQLLTKAKSYKALNHKLTIKIPEFHLKHIYYKIKQKIKFFI